MSAYFFILAAVFDFMLMLSPDAPYFYYFAAWLYLRRVALIIAWCLCRNISPPACMLLFFHYDIDIFMPPFRAMMPYMPPLQVLHAAFDAVASCHACSLSFLADAAIAFSAD